MRAKVKNQSLCLYNKELKVIKMNYDDIIVLDGDTNIHVQRDDVDFISECTYEDVIIRCEDIIKIKLNRGISIALYTKLVGFIEDKIEEKIAGIDVLKDEYRIIKKGLWEKDILLVINDKKPLHINIIGRNYSDKFDITIKDIRLEDFIDECLSEIEELEAEIQQKKNLSKRYEKSVANVIMNGICMSKTPVLLE